MGTLQHTQRLRKVWACGCVGVWGCPRAIPPFPPGPWAMASAHNSVTPPPPPPNAAGRHTSRRWPADPAAHATAVRTCRRRRTCKCTSHEAGPFRGTPQTVWRRGRAEASHAPRNRSLWALLRGIAPGLETQGRGGSQRPRATGATAAHGRAHRTHGRQPSEVCVSTVPGAPHLSPPHHWARGIACILLCAPTTAKRQPPTAWAAQGRPCGKNGGGIPPSH